MERRPHHHVVQLAQRIAAPRRGGIGFVLVDGVLPSLRIRFSFCAIPSPTLRLERRVVDPRRQVVLVRDRQRQHVVEVVDELLDRPAAVEARRARVADAGTLRPGAVGVDLEASDGLRKSKLPTTLTVRLENARDWREAKSSSMSSTQRCISARVEQSIRLDADVDELSLTRPAMGTGTARSASSDPTLNCC